MLNIQGFAKVTKIEREAKFTKATLYYGRKRQDGEYDNTFINAIFVGNAHESLGKVENKQEIYIDNGILENIAYVDKEGKNRQFLKLTVFDAVTDKKMFISTESSAKYQPKTAKVVNMKPRTRNIEFTPVDGGDIEF